MVLLGIFPHGLSARPGIAIYEKRAVTLGRGAPELK
jgi:hypothetical protein